MNILIIDADLSFAKTIRMLLKPHIDELNIMTARNLSTAVSEYLEQVRNLKGDIAIPESPEVAAKPATEQMLVTEQALQVTIGAETLESRKVECAMEHFLGHPIEKFKLEPAFWRTLVDINERSRFNAHLTKAKREGKVDDVFIFRDSEQRSFDTKVQVTEIKHEGQPALLVRLHATLAANPNDESAKKSQSGLRASHRIDVCFTAWELVSQQPKALCDKLAKEIRGFNTALGDESCLFLFSAFDAPNLDLKAILATAFQDIIFKPVDDLLFLQKMAVYVPRAFNGSSNNFLYTSERTFPADLGGEYPVLGTSESGLLVRNRSPFRKLSKAKLYSDQFGKAGQNGIYGFCFADRPYDKDPQQLLSSFTLVGLTPAHLTFLRNRLRETRDFFSIGAKEKAEEAPETQKKPGFKRRAPLEKRAILVIDLDEETIKVAKELVDRYFPTHEVVESSSFNDIMNSMGAGAFDGESDATTQWDLRPAFHPNRPLLLDLDPSSFRILKANDFPTETGLILGHTLAEVNALKEGWRDLLAGRDRLAFKDFLYYVASGSQARRSFIFKNKSDQFHKVQVFGSLFKGETPSIRLEMTDVTKAALEEAAVKTQSSDVDLANTDIVLLDQGFIRENMASSLERARQALHFKTGRDVPVFLLSRQLSLEEQAPLMAQPFQDLFFKPLDRGLVNRKLRVALQAAKDPTQLEKLESYVAVEGWMDLARPITVEGIGEYGLHFTHTSPVPIGAWGYFYHHALCDETGRGLVGRCYKVDSPAKNQHKCYFMFIGVRDNRLKQIRLFLKHSRETGENL